MDEELFERLVGEFAETRRHFDVVVEGFRTEVREELTEVRKDVSGLQGGLTEVREGLSGVRKDVSSLQAGQEELRKEVQETRRHSDVVAEGLRSEIRLVAEGVAVGRSE